MRCNNDMRLITAARGGAVIYTKAERERPPLIKQPPHNAMIFNPLAAYQGTHNLISFLRRLIKNSRTLCAADRAALICSALIIQKETSLSVVLRFVLCFVYPALLIRPTRLICGFLSMRTVVFAFSPPPKIDARIDWGRPTHRKPQRWAKDKCSFWVLSPSSRLIFFGASAKKWMNDVQRRFNWHLPQLCSFQGRMKYLVVPQTNSRANTLLDFCFGLDICIQN